jgi:alpha-1,6-mannosyltransferase
MTKRKALLLAIAALALLAYVWLGYFIPRDHFVQLLIAFVVLFALYWLLLRNKVLTENVALAIAIALVFRLSLLMATPALTDDYYRFIWDGLLVANGQNPYLVLPSAYIQGAQLAPGISLDLYHGLNSPDYYSVYPPVCQFIFGISARICAGNILSNIIVIRVLVLLAECGSIFFLFKLAKLLKAPAVTPFIYALNPLVILELSGNLHPEAFMIFFTLLAAYLLMKGKQAYSALSFGLAVGVKLIPLIFLPLLIKRLGFAKSIRYIVIVAGVFAILFAPFFSIEAVQNFLSSLTLYFKVFEFNAAFYYLARWLGYQIAGYNTIAFTGTALSVVSFGLIIALACTEKQTDWKSLFSRMLFCLTIYLLFATTVHPWYITTLVAITALTRYRYALVWSLLAVLSYAAYQGRPYTENLWLVAIEYVAVAGFIIFELARRKQKCSD